MVYAILSAAFTIYTLLILANVISSWFPTAQNWPVMRFVHWATDPYLGLFRKIIPPIAMIDFSPMIALIALQFLEQFLFWLIR